MSFQACLLVEKVEKDDPQVILNLKKTDMTENGLSGATISISKSENVSSVSSTSLTSANGGSFGSITVQPTSNTGTFKLKLAETKAPTGYIKVPGTVTLTVTYDKTTGAVTKITSDATEYVPNKTDNTVIVKNRPVVKLNFNKQDFSNNPLPGAKIKVDGKDNVENIIGRDTNNELTSGSNGKFGTITVEPTSNTGTFNLTVTETKAPTEYTEVPGTVTLTVEYNTDTGAVTKITSDKTEYVPNRTNNTVIVKNKPKVNLIINKIDSLTRAKLSGAKFKLELTNVESIENYQIPTIGVTQNSPRIVYVTTDSNGQASLTGIVPKLVGTNITATITEVEVPTGNGYYYKPIDPFIVTLTYNNATGKYSVSGTAASISGNTVTINIENQPLIDLSGIVWEDGQIGEKNVQGPNGNKDNEENGLSGVLVGLKRVSDGKIIKTVTTAENGAYEFLSVPMTKEGYQIVFSYDGINWQETKSIRNATDGDSDASESETDRTAFNNRFKTISAGQSNDGTALTYTYKNGDPTGESTLNVTMAGHTTGTTDAKFQISAQTGICTTTTSDIDCGLVKKELDLALGTDVKNATLKINEKETTYSYAQIMNGEMEDLSLDDILQNNSSSNEDVTYNLYLYASDYNYRISDYKTDDEAINNKLNPSDDTVNNYEDLKELEAYVTYSVILKNQSTYDATVEQFVYYYDEVYTPYNIASTDKYDVSINTNERKITFTSKNNGLIVNGNNNYRVEIDLTFKVNKDANNNIVLKDNVTNIAEITEYSTVKGGLIDKNSAPENANVTFTNGTPKVGQYEDDTDEAKGIDISVKEDKVRTITGTVFEDTDKDGKLNNENTAVNDVIVQLIEIKKISGKYYEYIWQETKSGSNQVKTTARNGYEGTTYTNSVTEVGKYEFKDFIPGNYIVRFIYGDGSTYDLTDNVKTYNGQDYKSTIDTNYTKPWYNTAGYTEEQSIARDNEARRLEVMAYSSTIDETKGEALERRNKEDLENTWMAAETSRINVPVDADNLATMQNNTSSSVKESGIAFGNVHFGLALRPKTELVLEKHITGLKITPNGTGVQSIVDAKANIEDIVNGETVEISGVTDGLAIIYSDRANRGFWQVATDVEELTQGAELEVEYTYVVRNNGEKDYLSKTLVEAYENQDLKPYKEVLTEIKDTVKGTMRSGSYSYSNTNAIGQYLGEHYYTGNIADSDAEVSSRIETVEEALNNDLRFDAEISGTDFTKINNEAVDKPIYDKDGNPETETIDTVVSNNKATNFLITETVDYSKKITLRTTLAASSGGELGANIPSYIAEVVQYSNAAGRRNMEAEPANLSYVHSDDKEMTLTNSWLYELDGKTYETQNKEEIPEGATNIREANEIDEFWGETIIITEPTGEDKLTPMQIALITIGSIGIIGVGIVLIKKFVLKK